MSGLPATVANLDPAVVVEVLVRHRCNVTDASADLGVPASDLRRLLWNNPKLQDEAFEVVEVRLDKAEKNIAEALDGDDSRCSDAASFFVLRNSARARRRGWITTSTSAAELSVSTGAPTARIRGRPMRLRGRSTRASCLSTIPTSVPTAGRRRSTADLTPRDRRRLADVRAPRPWNRQAVTLATGNDRPRRGSGRRRFRDGRAVSYSRIGCRMPIVRPWGSLGLAHGIRLD